MVQKSAAAKTTKAPKADKGTDSKGTEGKGTDSKGTDSKVAAKAQNGEPKEDKPKKAAAPKKTAAKIEEPAPAPAPPPPPKKPVMKAHRHLRAPIEIRVEVTARSQSFTTTSRNIALGGISFESQQQFRVGDLVNVLLYIPVRKDLELLKCASEIVWVEDLGGSWMCGAAFRKFAPGDERRLREWLLESVRAQKAGLTALPQPADFIDDDDG